jgi:hypothetical protein
LSTALRIGRCRIAPTRLDPVEFATSDLAYDPDRVTERLHGLARQLGQSLERKTARNFEPNQRVHVLVHPFVSDR